MKEPTHPDAATPQYRVIMISDVFRILDSNGATVAETYLRGPEDKRIADAIVSTLNDPSHAQLTACLAACRKALEIVREWWQVETKTRASAKYRSFGVAKNSEANAQFVIDTLLSPARARYAHIAHHIETKQILT